MSKGLEGNQQLQAEAVGSFCWDRTSCSAAFLPRNCFRSSVTDRIPIHPAYAKASPRFGIVSNVVWEGWSLAKGAIWVGLTPVSSAPIGGCELLAAATSLH